MRAAGDAHAGDRRALVGDDGGDRDALVGRRARRSRRSGCPSTSKASTLVVFGRSTSVKATREAPRGRRRRRARQEEVDVGDRSSRRRGRSGRPRTAWNSARYAAFRPANSQRQPRVVRRADLECRRPASVKITPRAARNWFGGIGFGADCGACTPSQPMRRERAGAAQIGLDGLIGHEDDRREPPRRRRARSRRRGRRPGPRGRRPRGRGRASSETFMGSATPMSG